jgi:hypothetical protein
MTIGWLTGQRLIEFDRWNQLLAETTGHACLVLFEQLHHVWIKLDELSAEFSACCSKNKLNIVSMVSFDLNKDWQCSAVDCHHFGFTSFPA